MALRQLSRAAVSRLGSSSSSSGPFSSPASTSYGYLQARCAGNMPVKPNKYIEDWATARENVELTYKLTPWNLRNIALYVVVVPVVIYSVIVRENHKTDDKYRPKDQRREFM